MVRTSPVENPLLQHHGHLRYRGGHRMIPSLLDRNPKHSERRNIGGAGAQRRKKRPNEARELSVAHQNWYFAPNCITRGARVPVMRPNPVGAASDQLLGALN